ncbi:MAG: ATP-binding protein [Calothrix sp. MO_192.B10]|nr:ATP-binding protein [Calothrix sp. MO_192.B10]
MLHQIHERILPPSLSTASDVDLSLDSRIEELPMYSSAVEISFTGEELGKYLDKYPQLPGVILVEGGIYYGMISRRRFLELLINPQCKEFFFQQPLSVIYSYARTAILQLPANTHILKAMQLALRRCSSGDPLLRTSPEALTEPIVVQNSDHTYSLLDIQELHLAAWLLQGIETQIRYERSQVQVIQNEKMASLGRLVDGITHEILDPVGFIWGNLTYVSNYSQDLLKLIDAYEQELPEIPEDISLLKEEIEFDFLEKDLSQVLSSVKTGAERLKKMVTSLQNFCHLDAIYQKPIDIHSCIDNIILLIKSRVKKEIQIITNYDVLPPVLGFPGELHQVFMTLVSYAVDNLLNTPSRHQLNPESHLEKEQPKIEITTSVISRDMTNDNIPDSRWIVICIADNGAGISEAEQQEILALLAAGKKSEPETSLALSYRIITTRHGGEFNLRSQLGQGTEIEILLPLL